MAKTLYFVDAYKETNLETQWETQAGRGSNWSTNPNQTGRYDGAGGGVWNTYTLSRPQNHRWYFPNSEYVYVHFAYKPSPGQASTNDRAIFNINTSNGSSALAAQLVLRSNSDGSLFVSRGYPGTTILTTSAGVFDTAGQDWQSIEILARVHDTLGVYKIRIDGVEVANFSGDTKDIAATSHLGITIWPDGFWDDVAVATTDGTSDAEFLGADWRATALFPTSDDELDFTPSSGGSGFAMVDESQNWDADTTYNSSSTVGHEDLFGHTTLTDAGDILGVSHKFAARAASAGTVTARAVCKSGGTKYYSTAFTLTTGYVYYEKIWQTDPDTGSPWTQAGLNAATFGYELTTTSGPAMRVTQNVVTPFYGPPTESDLIAGLLTTGDAEIYPATIASTAVVAEAAGLEVAYIAPAGSMVVEGLGLEVAYIDPSPQLYDAIPLIAPAKGAQGFALAAGLRITRVDGTFVYVAPTHLNLADGPVYEWGVVSLGSVRREVDPQFRSHTTSEMAVSLDNSTGVWSQLIGQGQLKVGCVIELMMGDPEDTSTWQTVQTARLVNFRLTARQLDLSGVDIFDNKLDSALTIPVTQDSFPNLPEDTIPGIVPILIGTATNDQDGDRLGAMPGYLTDPQFFLSPGVSTESAQLDGPITDSDVALTVKSPSSYWPEDGSMFVQIGSEILFLFNPTNDGLDWECERAKNATVAASHLDSATITPLLGFRAVLCQGDIESVDSLFVKGLLKVGGGAQYEIVRETGSQLFFTADTVVYADLMVDPRGDRSSEGWDSSLPEITWDGKGLKDTATGLTYSKAVEQLQAFLVKHAGNAWLGTGNLTDDDFDAASATRAQLDLDQRDILSTFVHDQADVSVRDVLDRFAETFLLVVTTASNGKLRFLVARRSVQSKGFKPHLVEEAHIMTLEVYSAEEVVGSSRTAWRYDWTTKDFSVAEYFPSADSFTGRVGNPDQSDLWFIRDDSSANTVTRDHLYFAEAGRTFCYLEVDPWLYDQALDVGDDFAVTHRAGPSADGLGWRAKWFRVISRGLDFSDPLAVKMTLRAVDIEPYQKFGDGSLFIERMALDAWPGDPQADLFDPLTSSHEDAW